jgi:hypothetical protein
LMNTTENSTARAGARTLGGEGVWIMRQA